MQNKKLLTTLVLGLLILGATKSIASLTFSDSAISGTAPSSIDVGAGNTLSLQTTNNGAITTGTGLTTLGGGLNVAAAATINLLKISSGSMGDSVFIGANGVDSESTGYYNIGIGEFSLSSVTSGRSNTALGVSALGALTISRNNTAIGFNALSSFIGNSATTEYNTAIGAGAGMANLTGIQNTYLGASTSTSTAFSNSTVVGYGATASASNQVVLGNASITEIQAGTGGVAKVTATGLQLKTASQPSCSSTTAGEFWYVAGGTGVKDTVNVCAKDAANAYAWRTLY